MKRGVVVEYNDDYVTLLTPDGQFLKTQKPEKGPVEIGEEISFFPILDEREEAVTRHLKPGFFDFLRSRTAKVGALSFFAIMLFLTTLFPIINNNEVYAYMSIDINPSFEVGIDEKLNVISLEPLNEEAKLLIPQLPKWENRPFNDTVDAILETSLSEGYIQPGKEVLITTVVTDENQKVKSDLEEGISDIRQSFDETEMVIKSVEADRKTREMAQKHGVSTGKYLREKSKILDSKEVNDKKADEKDKAQKKPDDKKVIHKEDKPKNSEEIQSGTNNANQMKQNKGVSDRLEGKKETPVNEKKNDKVRKEPYNKVDIKKNQKTNDKKEDNKDKKEVSHSKIEVELDGSIAI